MEVDGPGFLRRGALALFGAGDVVSFARGGTNRNIDILSGDKDRTGPDGEREGWKGRRKKRRMFLKKRRGWEGDEMSVFKRKKKGSR